MCTLQYISEHEVAAVYQKDIESFLRIRRSSVSSLLKKLETGGLLMRVPVPEDARLKRLFLTEQGRSLVEEIEGLHARIEQYISSILTQEEVESLNSILEKIARGMDGLEEVMQGKPEHL